MDVPGPLTAVFAFGVPGLKEVLLVAFVALALYGRSGSRLLTSTRSGRAVAPWLNLIRVPSSTRARPGRGPGSRPAGAADAPAPGAAQGRWFWALALTAAAAVAAWVATRLVIHNASGPLP